MNMPARNLSRIVPGILLAVSVLGCAKKEAPASASPGKPAANASAPAVAPGQAAGGASSVSMASSVPAGGSAQATASGTILETMDAAGYTYMLLKTANGETWVAVNQAKVKKGDTVSVYNAVPMDGFESKTLKRTFEHILFGSLEPAPGGAPAAGTAGAAKAPAAPMGPMASGHAPAGAQDPMANMAAQHAAAANAPVQVGEIKVKKAEGPDGKTVAEIFAAKAKLKDKQVSVRGQVVKFNAEIMGRNWIHIRDGSGSREKKDDDLTVTTKVKVAVGDVILVSGALNLDRDFGAGYSYPVIIEDAKVSK